MNLPDWPGWRLIGAFPRHKLTNGVGSWLLVNGGEALLLETPAGLMTEAVQSVLATAGATLRFVTASHAHRDHLKPEAWDALMEAFPDTEFIHPFSVKGDRLLDVGGEPLWLVKAPKHSLTDVVTVFRGVAMTGDIELGMLASVNDQVPLATKRRSMRRLAEFEGRTGYRVHSIVSAHLNDVRQGIHWPDLFEV